MLLQGVADAVPGLVADLNCWKLDKITGEASVAKRKGKKVIVIYELEVTVKWESTLKNVAGQPPAPLALPLLSAASGIDKVYGATRRDHQHIQGQLHHALHRHCRGDRRLRDPSEMQQGRKGARRRERVCEEARPGRTESRSEALMRLLSDHAVTHTQHESSQPLSSTDSFG